MTSATDIPAIRQIEEIQQKIRELKGKALAELKEKLAQAKRNVVDMEAQLATMTGQPVPVTSVFPRVRPRWPFVSDEELKPQIIKVVLEKGKYGISAKAIAEHLGHDPIRVRKFLADNPDVLKRQGDGPGMRFFLK